MVSSFHMWSWCQTKTAGCSSILRPISTCGSARKQRCSRVDWSGNSIVDQPSAIASDTGLQDGQFLQLHWGWMVQQYVKLSAGKVVDTSMWVCVDSDVFFMRHMGEEDFRSSKGRPLLLELVDSTSGPTSIEFRDASARLLGIAPEALDPRILYTSWIVPMERGVVDELLPFVERRTRGHWWEAMAQVGATEYETYGLFARHIHGLRNVDPGDRRWCWLFYDVTKLNGMLRYAIEEIGVKAAMVDAHLSCDFPSVQEVVRSRWIP